MHSLDVATSPPGGRRSRPHFRPVPETGPLMCQLMIACGPAVRDTSRAVRAEGLVQTLLAMVAVPVAALALFASQGMPHGNGVSSYDRICSPFINCAYAIYLPARAQGPAGSKPHVHCVIAR